MDALTLSFSIALGIILAIILIPVTVYLVAVLFTGFATLCIIAIEQIEKLYRKWH